MKLKPGKLYRTIQSFIIDEKHGTYPNPFLSFKSPEQINQNEVLLLVKITDIVPVTRNKKQINTKAKYIFLINGSLIELSDFYRNDYISDYLEEVQ
jgi:hypothetical protein